jgi:hypothetical protein
MILKVSLELDEIQALQKIRNVNCSGISCQDCPYYFKDVCMSTLARDVLRKIGVEPTFR